MAYVCNGKGVNEMQTLTSIMCFVLLLLFGCTVMQIREENKQAELRIASKEKILSDEEIKAQQLKQQRDDLEKEKERLLLELDTKQMTLDELFADLEKLERENARLQKQSEKTSIQEQNLAQQLRHYKEEITELRGDQPISSADKARRIEELKEEIRNYLRLGLDKK
jgi:septal ring factor EnvC (AmiA/AmiB activator)